MTRLAKTGAQPAKNFGKNPQKTSGKNPKSPGEKTPWRFAGERLSRKAEIVWACADAASRPDAQVHRMNTGKTARRPDEETTSIPVRKSQGGDLTVWSGCA
jgi:hypothetical protein